MQPDIVTSVSEGRLFETVRLIREWIECSFEPSQEARFRKNGNKLMARFDVDLGSNMREELQTYINASFVLSRLQIRFTTREHGKVERPCVEVLLNESARSLYAQKHPRCIAKSQVAPEAIESTSVPLPLPNSESNGKDMVLLADKACRSEHTSSKVVGANGAIIRAPATAKSPQDPPNDANVSPWEVVEPMMILRGVQGAQEARDILETCLASQGPDANSRAHPKALKAQKTAVACLKGLMDFEVTEQCLRETRIGHAVNAWRKEKDEYISGLAVKVVRKLKAQIPSIATSASESPSTPAPTEHKRKADLDMETPPSKKAILTTSIGMVKQAPAEKQAMEHDRQLLAIGSGFTVFPREIRPDMGGIQEAKDALEACLANQNSEISAKTQKDAVAWLKGLEETEITLEHLRTTLIGQTVNKWQKESEPLISSIASRLVKKWRMTAKQEKTQLA